MDLFLDQLPDLDRSFRKEAGFTARLSEAPENWQQEITSELMKQLPYLADYNIDTHLDKVEEQRGFAFGYADVSNRTDRPVEEHGEAGLPHIRIPVIVAEKSLKPFSVYLDGERVLPLTEDRIREALFNPTTFDLTTNEPRDPSLLETLMPPQRAGAGAGGEYKTASVKTKVAFSHISSDQWSALYQNEKIQKLVQKFGSAQHPEVDNAIYELASKRYGFHPKTASVKTANDLTAAGRDHVKGSNFVFPETRRYPIHDVSHARNALARASGKSEEAQVRTVVHAKYPNIGKEKKSSLLMAIAPTIREKDADRFIEKVSSDMTLVAGFQRSGVTGLLVEVFDKTKRASADERLLAVAENVLPTVTTIHKLPGGQFLVKQASVDSFAGGEQAQGEVVGQQEMGEAIGAEEAQAMRPGETATAVSDPVEEEPITPTEMQPVENFGQYQVQDLQGNRLVGHVFESTLSWDGNFTPSPVALFTNGSSFAVQDVVAGELVGKGTTLPVEQPRGEGTFYFVEGGKAVATAPVLIRSSATGPDGQPQYVGEDLFGNPISVQFVDGLKSPTRISDSEYALPSNWKFMRLNNQTQLVQSGEQQAKTAALRRAFSEVTIFWNGSYNVTGGCGLEKISSDLRQDLDLVGAEFLLGLLGVDGSRAKNLVKEARKSGAVKVAGLKTIHTLAERYSSATKVASALVSKIPDLRKDLVKEAAGLEDEGTVDHILALNFVNPENVATFVEYIPELEATGEKLAEMLLMSYVGQDSLPEAAIERAMTNLEETVSGLKALQQAEA